MLWRSKKTEKTENKKTFFYLSLYGCVWLCQAAWAAKVAAFTQVRYMAALATTNLVYVIMKKSK